MTPGIHEISILFNVYLSIFSSWAEQNVDPSLFPQELMANFYYLVGDEEVGFSYNLYILLIQTSLVS